MARPRCVRACVRSSRLLSKRVISHPPETFQRTAARRHFSFYLSSACLVARRDDNCRAAARVEYPDRGRDWSSTVDIHEEAVYEAPDNTTGTNDQHLPRPRSLKAAVCVTRARTNEFNETRECWSRFFSSSRCEIDEWESQVSGTHARGGRRGRNDRVITGTERWEVVQGESGPRGEEKREVMCRRRQEKFQRAAARRGPRIVPVRSFVPLVR